MRVYLDNCCYNRPYDDQSQIKVNLETRAKLDIQRQIREGTLELVSSYVLVAENSANHFENKRIDITDKRLLKYNTDRIRLLNPIEFINETED